MYRFETGASNILIARGDELQATYNGTFVAGPEVVEPDATRITPISMQLDADALRRQ